MLLTFDRTNFPLLALEELGLEMHLLPVTKQQFEPFVSKFGKRGAVQYREMLALNPAIPPDRFTAAEREQLFITGVLSAEAQSFARWLGEGFDLPTAAE